MISFLVQIEFRARCRFACLLLGCWVANWVGHIPCNAHQIGQPGLPTVVVVRPAAWSNSLNEWKKYRQSNYHIVELDAQESAYELRLEILNAVSRSNAPVKAILLCGDVALVDRPNDPKTTYRTILPTFDVPTRVKLGEFTTPTLATDVFYSDIDNDMCPDIAIGRLPAKSEKDLKRMLDRSIHYEQSQSFGPWRERIHATAGVGGFGVFADAAIEAVARRLLSEGIPDRFQLQMTYASATSPYCPDPNRITNSFINRINDGGLFWVYIGHGNVHHLDYFRVGRENIPICNGEHVSQFAIQDGPPVALMLACFTGAYDARIDCFAEMLLANNHGPIAVIAGSRVTMPYGLTQFSSELMDGCFVEKTETLGELILRAKQRIWQNVDSQNDTAGQTNTKASMRERQKLLIEQMASALSPEGHDLLEERREHVRLMNLLGDPLLTIRYPMQMPLECDSMLSAGKFAEVTIQSPISGKLRVEFVLARDRLPDGLKTIRQYNGSKEQREIMQENYAQACDLVLQDFEQEVQPGKTKVSLEIPANCRGRYVIRAVVYGNNNWASGSQRVNVSREQP